MSLDQSTELEGMPSVDERSRAERWGDLDRIEKALGAAASVLLRFRDANIAPELKSTGDPITAADRAVNQLLLEMLPQTGEGWLSEESADDAARLNRSRVWIVDPLDGTREFVAGIPEWCVSIGLVEAGRAVAGGICNPATGETIFGSMETGLTACMRDGMAAMRPTDKRVRVLASRSEASRGEWDWLDDSLFSIHPVGSVAYKLALVAAGFADATWTFVPKHEWDVAAGVALVLASGGVVATLEGAPPDFNRSDSLISGLIAISAKAHSAHRELIREWISRGLKARA